MKNTLITLTTIATLGVSGDAMVYNGQVIDEQSIPVANETVDVQQVDNVVEATLPWKGEDGITVAYDLGEPTLIEKVEDKRAQEVIMQPITAFDGGFKVDVLLNEKPTTNVFCYAIQGAENYDFFYQPPLTDKERADGDIRPPEIEGSYAVYHKTLRDNEYKTGKYMHIPRPQVWSLSDESTKVWADMHYDAGQLCVTVPQDFLDTATYPVRVDPTFGYTSVGASSDTLTSALRGNRYTALDNGTVTGFYMYFSTGINSDQHHMFLFETTVPSNRHSYSIASTTAANLPLAWRLFSTSSVGALKKGQAYHLVFNQGGNTSNVRYDSTANEPSWVSTSTSAYPYAAQVSIASTGFGSTRTWSIYTTYQTDVPAVITNASIPTGARTAILGGLISNFATVTPVVGFTYGTNSNLVGGDTATITIGTSTEAYVTYKLRQLLPSTQYYYNFFAENGQGRGWGSVQSFVTGSEQKQGVNNGTIKINNGTLKL